MHLKNCQKGIGLVETIIALGVAIIVITSMVSLAIFTLRASLQNKLQLEGTQLATQEIELVRAYRDSNSWSDFSLALSDSSCIGSSSKCYVCVSGAGCPGIQSGEEVIKAGTTEELKRSFRVIDVNGDGSVLRVAVTVSWQVGADAKYAYSYTELSNWRSR